MGKRTERQIERDQVAANKRYFAEMCDCGHYRGEHVHGYRHCGICSQSDDGKFRSEAGWCDRFTWARSNAQ